MWLRNSWYQAAWSDELTDRPALVRKILGEQILFMRNEEGGISAILDMCPHRFAPLSAGKISNGVVTCGYHGLAFNGKGACVGNPHGPVTQSMKVRSFPVIERHQAVWIWMGDSEKGDPALIRDLSFIDETPEAARIAGYMPTAANYQLLSDNILDLSHADYLHPTTLGGMMSASKTTTRVDGDDVVVEWLAQDCAAPPAFQPQVPSPAKADIWLQVRWSAPALMVLSGAAKHAGVPREAEDISETLHNMTPETPTSSHYFYCNTRRFELENSALTAMLREAMAQAFVAEDKPMLEKQQARMGTSDFWKMKPLLLNIDAAAVRARRKLDTLIEAEMSVQNREGSDSEPSRLPSP